MAVRRSNHSARSHPFLYFSLAENVTKHFADSLIDITGIGSFCLGCSMLNDSVGMQTKPLPYIESYTATAGAAT